MSDLDRYGLFEDADVANLVSQPKFDIHEENVNDQPLAAAAGAGPDVFAVRADLPALSSAGPHAAAAA